MWLIIVESPSKCRKIEEYLGSNYKCIASVGHFRTLKSIDEQYTPIFSMEPDKKEIVSKLRKTISLSVPPDKNKIRSFPKSSLTNCAVLCSSFSNELVRY